MNDTTQLTGLTLQEKASLTSGRDFWNTKGVERVGIEPMLLTDGPHGVRNQRPGEQLNLADSVPATCFPPAAGLANSFDAELIERVGTALGVEAAAQNVAVLLGPGINIKRSPLCGRNFEYFSEDPVLTGVLGEAWVRGLQSRGVGASLKHFAANNQETDRMRVSSDVDERTLREIYLRGFQRVIQRAAPWTVMCSYNRINGIPVSENPWLLTTVLRDEWGFDGVVMSDWGAVGDRVKALIAGLDLEMPTSGGRTDRQIVAAVEAGELDQAILDTAATRMLRLGDRTTNGTAAEVHSFDADEHHALAREAASRSVVLLKNDGDLLPLNRDQSLAIIGAFAVTPRYQGAGSSLINPTRLDDALSEIQRAATGQVTYAPGFVAGGADPARDSALVADAVAAAEASDVAVLFLGLPDEDESEGFDRRHIDLPDSQRDLLDAVVRANPRTVVVLSHGGVVALPFADRVPAILDCWLLGQAGGGATADVLFGAVDPSGRLAETIPLRLSDAPSYLSFPGEFGHVRYSEGIFVGYRGYDARELEVAYPFGHGLSYTTFEYSDASAAVTADGDLQVEVTISNTGRRRGREIVQVYTGLPGSGISRAVRELKAFASVELASGASQKVRLVVDREDLAYWDTRIDAWTVEPGEYRIDVAASSRDVRASVRVAVAGDAVDVPLTLDSSVSEVLAHPGTAGVLEGIIASRGEQGALLTNLFDPTTEIGMLNASFPVGRLTMAGLTEDEIAQLIRS